MSTQQSTTGNSAAAGGGFAGLHAMSRTAGVGASDYTAVNVASVWAMVAGLASFLVLLSNVLLVVPIAAILFGVVGFVQVSRSNGTQTGRSMAVGGIVLALAAAGYSVAGQLAAAAATRDDRAEMRQLVDQLEGALKARDYAAAHAQFSSRFQESYPLERFTRFIEYLESRTYGAFESLELGDVVRIREDRATGMREAASMLHIVAEKAPADLDVRTGITFTDTGEGWKIDSILDWF